SAMGLFDARVAKAGRGAACPLASAVESKTSGFYCCCSRRNAQPANRPSPRRRRLTDSSPPRLRVGPKSGLDVTCEEWKQYASDLFREASPNHDGVLTQEERVGSPR